jgi:hypothetical protein
VEDERDHQLDAAPTVPVRLVEFDETPVHFVTAVHVTDEWAVFQLVFSQFMQPVVLGSVDVEAIARRGYVPARGVARLALTPALVEETIAVLRAQLERHNERQ